MKCDVLRSIGAVCAVLGTLALAGVAARAQDGRGTVTEPTIPAVCTQVAADLTISGGEPSSELNTIHDTSIIQTALSGCASGEAVELVAGGGNDAFVISPIFIPAGVTLLVDGGVTVFASRNPVDYQIGTASSGNTCGTSDGGSACYALITLGQASVGGNSSTYYTAGATPVTGIMGYGVINGRGGDKLIALDSQTNPTTYTVGSSSSWDLATTGNEDVPVLVQVYKTPSVVLYKITLLNSPHFHVRITGQGNVSAAKYQTNFTVWGLKLLTPWSAKNTDGVDPTGANNVTITNSIIGDGDDEIAISGSSLSENFTFSNLLLTSGHGVSIGSITTNSVSNVAVNNVNFSGQAADDNQIALRIKSYCSKGGAVSNVVYNGVCARNVYRAIDLDPFYDSTSSTTSCPAYGTPTAPISYNNIYLTTGGKINFQGYNSSADLSYVALDNVYDNAAALNLGGQSSDTTATPANDNVTLSGSYYPSGWGTLNTAANATNVTEVNSGTPAASFPSTYCANAFPALEGELYADTTSGGVTANNINQPVSITLPATVTLNAMVQPTNPTTGYGAATAAAAPTAGVQFLDGTTVVGTAAIGGNGTLASVVLTNPTAGIHSYTASYLGDSNYAVTAIGTTTATGTQNGATPPPNPLVVTVMAGPAAQLAFTAAPPASLVYGTATGTVTVSTEDVAGDAVSSNASVTLTITGPNSYNGSSTVSAVNGVATFTLTTPLPGVGSYNFTASSTGLTGAAASETIAAATLTVTAQPASRVFDAPNPAFPYQIAGYVNSDTSAVVSGAPLLTTAALPDSNAGMYPIGLALGTLTAANYNFAATGSTLTVNGGAPQAIDFAPLPNFPSGGSYQLTAHATSGLPVTYSATGATLSGTTLHVTSPGPVTVTAANSGNGNYAQAASVTQGFTAQ